MQRIHLTKVRHGEDAVALLRKYNPSLQADLCASPAECHTGDYPTLGMLNVAYGRKTAVMWLLPQLYNLSEYCGCREKLGQVQIEECASIIANEYNYLKISEMMLFFYRFKAGRYGRFYGSVDPLIITTSLHSFIRERNDFEDKLKSEEIDRRIEEQKKNCISYAEYLRRKAEKEAGGTTASNAVKQG